MARRPILLAALLLLGVGLFTFCPAGIKPYSKLSRADRAELLESQERLAADDLALQELDLKWVHHRIARQEYLYEEHDLVAMIGVEAKCQNDLLSSDPLISENAREVLNNITKYSIEVPGYAFLFALGVAGEAHLQFSP